MKKYRETALSIRVMLALVSALMAGMFSLSVAHADPVDPLDSSATPTTVATQTQKEAPQTQPTQTTESQSNGGSNTENSNDGGSAARDFTRNYHPLQDFNPSDNVVANTLLNGIGWLTSLIFWAVAAGQLFVTACDLLYINIPFVRPWLADAGEDGMGQNLPGMGGFGGMGGMGGMGGGAQKSSIMNRQWVSDECIFCVKGLGGSAQAQFGGGGMGFGGMGRGMGFGSMGAVPQQQPNERKTVMGQYVKERAKVLILFGVAFVLLGGSTFMGFGMDIAGWLLKLIAYVGAWINHQDVPNLLGGH